MFIYYDIDNSTMEKKKIYFIYMPSPILGRNPIQGVTGSSIFGALFNLYTEDNYILALQKAIAQKNLDWHVYRDDTESDIKNLLNKVLDFWSAPQV